MNGKSTKMLGQQRFRYIENCQKSFSRTDGLLFNTFLWIISEIKDNWDIDILSIQCTDAKIECQSC